MVVIVSVFLRLIFGGKKKPTRVEKTNVEPAETATSQGSGENEENKEKEESSAPARRRPTRRDN